MMYVFVPGQVQKTKDNLFLSGHNSLPGMLANYFASVTEH